MKIKDVVSTLDYVDPHTVPWGEELLDKVNAFVSDDQALPPDVSGTDVVAFIASLPAEQQTVLLGLSLKPVTPKGKLDFLKRRKELHKENGPRGKWYRDELVSGFRDALKHNRPLAIYAIIAVFFGSSVLVMAAFGIVTGDTLKPILEFLLNVMKLMAPAQPVALSLQEAF